MQRLWMVLAALAFHSACAESLAMDPLDLDAKSYFLVDYSSGRVLAEGAADEQLHPASLTKLMTSYVVFSALRDGIIDETDEVLVSEKAWRMRGSRMFIEVDKLVPVDDLLHGMIIQSGNDASVALAEHVAGSEEAFVELMNAQAKRLGMERTQYKNATGLPARDHYTTARDTAVLARALISEFPEHYGLYSERDYTFNSIKQHNRNALLWRDHSVDGLKTGYTVDAGYCLVASAERDGMRLVAVVLGMPTAVSRIEGGQSLLDYGFENFETHRLYARGEQITEVQVPRGEPQLVGVGLEADLFVTVPRGEYDALRATMELVEDFAPPFDAGQTVGEVTVRFRDDEVSRTPVVSLDAVTEAGLLSRLAVGVKLLLE
jgi:D-alanyl-D-alanine carboxypeptidase (penicillin-binding protein 5/6)